MKLFISKLKSAFSEKKSAAHSNNEAFIEAIINDVEGSPFAISETNVLYAGLSELAGYHYFKTIIIGTLQLKTFQGAKLIIKGTDFKLELNSDSLELESESSTIPNRNITRIDFEIDHDDVSKITKTAIESIEIMAKKNHVQFSIIEVEFDEELADEELADEILADEELAEETFTEEVENMKEE